jgi:hypothetical protein
MNAGVAIDCGPFGGLCDNGHGAKNAHLLRHFILKTIIFSMDRLGTNIGKALKRDAFSQGSRKGTSPHMGCPL